MALLLAMAIHGRTVRRAAGGERPRQPVRAVHAHLWDLMHGNTTGDLLFN